MQWLVTLPGRALRSIDIIGMVIALCFLGLTVWPGWLRQAREDGAAGERLAWVIKQEEWTAKHDAAVAQAQIRVDRAESSMIAALAEIAVKTNDLEAALAAERKTDAEPGQAGAAGNRCLPRRMPERVRRALNAFRGQ